MEKILNLAMLISGGGTTMEAIALAVNSGKLKGIKPRLVISSRSEAGGIQRAKQAGISEEDILVIRPKDYATREAFGEALVTACQARQIDVIGQYGWMPLTPANLITTYQGKIINQHLGPLDPGYPGYDFGGQGMYGMRVHCARLYFVRAVQRDFWTEATAHLVTEQYDEGELLGTKRVEILPDDTPVSLQQRTLPAEWELQIDVLRQLAEGTLKPFRREERLVLPGEEGILATAKQVAGQLFPKG